MNPRPDNPTQNFRRQPLWSATLLALLLLLASAPGTAAVRASLDRDTVYTDDIFILTIESATASHPVSNQTSPLWKRISKYWALVPAPKYARFSGMYNYQYQRRAQREGTSSAQPW